MTLPNGRYVICAGCGTEFYVPLNRFKRGKLKYCSNSCRPIMDPQTKIWKAMFFRQRDHSKLRGIEWQLAFEQWLQIWQDSGHLHERGREVGQYQMARNGDIGPYSPDNVRIVTVQRNLTERDPAKWSGINSGVPRKLTIDDVRQIRALKGIEKQRALANRFGISIWSVIDIQKRRTWRWLPIVRPGS